MNQYTTVVKILIDFNSLVNFIKSNDQQCKLFRGGDKINLVIKARVRTRRIHGSSAGLERCSLGELNEI